MPSSTAKPENATNQNVDKLEKISASLEAIASSLQSIFELGFIWTQPNILSSLPHIFNSSTQLKVYLLSDGTLSTRDIGKIVNLSHTTIKRWWDKWSSEFDIVERDEKSGSYKKRYSLADLVAVFGDQQQKENDDERASNQ
jgi:hypothetical protein